MMKDVSQQDLNGDDGMLMNPAILSRFVKLTEPPEATMMRKTRPV